MKCKKCNYKNWNMRKGADCLICGERLEGVEVSEQRLVMATRSVDGTIDAETRSEENRRVTPVEAMAIVNVITELEQKASIEIREKVKARENGSSHLAVLHQGRKEAYDYAVLMLRQLLPEPESEAPKERSGRRNSQD